MDADEIMQKCGEYGRCISCTWFEETDPIVTPDGWCFRMPHTEPKNKKDWCGEWKSK